MTEKDNPARLLQYENPPGTRRLRPPERFTAILLARLLLAVNAVELGEPELAASIGYSVSQCRRFAEHVLGESISGFGRRLRLERAAGHLSIDGEGISKIGVEAGYATAAAFSRAFLEWFGSSPSEFRALNSSVECLLPGYLLSATGGARLPNSVEVRLADSSPVCFMYDGPVLLGRRLPSGVIDFG